MKPDDKSTEIRPVRIIPKNYRSVTGLIISNKSLSPVAYESRLEHDFMKLMEFDSSVLKYVEQPVKIHYTDTTGKARTYTPDLLVFYYQHNDTTSHGRPLLIEIKYRKDLFKHWPTLKPKFRAARRYARDRDWQFKIMTEIEIRTPYLTNVLFLLEYRDLPIIRAYTSLLLETLARLDAADPVTLLQSVAKDRIEQAQIIPMLWQLIARHAIGADLTMPLSMRTKLWAVD